MPIRTIAPVRLSAGERTTHLGSKLSVHSGYGESPQQRRRPVLSSPSSRGLTGPNRLCLCCRFGCRNEKTMDKNLVARRILVLVTILLVGMALGAGIAVVSIKGRAQAAFIH